LGWQVCYWPMVMVVVQERLPLGGKLVMDILGQAFYVLKEEWEEREE